MVHLAIALLVALIPLGLGQTEQAHAATSSRTLQVGMGGGTSQTTAYDGTSAPPSSIQSWFPYTSSFSGGTRVALGDVNGDGVPDAITAPGAGVASTIKIYGGTTVGPSSPSLIGSITPFGASYAGGVFVAAGDVNGDGVADVVAGTDSGTAAQVKAFDGRTSAVLATFLPFGAMFAGGVRVATGDIDGDGLADIIVAPGPGGGPHVSVFSGASLGGASPALIRDFDAFSTSLRSGVFVAAGDVNGDGADDIVAGTDAGTPTHVKVFDGQANGTELGSFFPFTSSFTGGARVAAGDVDGDGRADVVAGAGPGGGPHVSVFGGIGLSGTSPTPIRDFFALDGAHNGGVYVAGAPVPRATQLQFSVQPGGAHFNQPLDPQPVVRALDASGNPVASFTGQVTLSFDNSPQGAALNGTTTVTAVNGVATFTNISISAVYNAYRLRASSGPLTPAVSSTFAVTEPPSTGGTHLAFIASPGGAVAGRAFQSRPAVGAFKGDGNIDSTFSGTITIKIGTNPSNGTLSGPTSVTASSGVAAFDNLSIDKPGTGYTLIIEAAGLSSATSQAFTVAEPPPAVATSLRFDVVPTTARAGLLLDPRPVVRVLDQSGAPFTGFSGPVTVSLGANPVQGALGGTRTVQAVNGVAAFPGLSIDKAGTGYTLVASAAGLPSATSGSLNVLASRVACSPRSNLELSVAPAGAGRLHVTIRAPRGAGNEDNRLRSVRFETAVNGVVDLPAFAGSAQAPARGGLTGSPGNTTATLTEQPIEVTFTIRRSQAGQAATVPLVVADGCGDWKTFVGGGPTAF